MIKESKNIKLETANLVQAKLDDQRLEKPPRLHVAEVSRSLLLEQIVFYVVVFNYIVVGVIAF